MLCEIGQIEKDKITDDFTYMWNLKYKTKNKLMYTENKQVVTREEGS